MAEKKKDPKSGVKRGSRSTMAYVAGSRRYFNKLKAVTRHVRENPRDGRAKKWRSFMESQLALHYVRGAEEIRVAFQEIYG